MKSFPQFKKIIRFILNHPVGKRNTVRALYNLFSWQASQFISPGRKVVPFIGKVKLSATRGMAGATGNIYTGLHEFSDMGFLLHFLRKEDLFADVGANIGSYTMLASGYIGCKTFCFEPVPSTFENLMENIKVNKLGDLVTAFNKGVGSRSGKLLFTSGNDSVNHVVKEKGAGVIEVPVVCLDEVFAETQPILMKIDVEGFETEVLNGMDNLLAGNNLKAIIIELNGSGERYGFNEAEIHNKLLGHDFKPFAYDPLTRKLEGVKQHGSHNTIYIRHKDFVMDRINSARPVKIFSTTF